MAGVNLVKQLKARKSGAADGIPSASGQKFFGLDISSLRDGFGSLDRADKVRLILMVAGILSIFVARDRVHEYTAEKEAEKHAEIDRVAHDLEAEKAKLVALKSLGQEAQAYEKQMQELQRKMTLIESLGRNRNAAVKMVDFIVNRMPANLWLGKLDLDITSAADKVALTGNATNMQTVSDFMRELEGAVFFPRWELQGAERAEGKPTAAATATGGAASTAKSTVESGETRTFSLEAKVVPL